MTKIDIQYICENKWKMSTLTPICKYYNVFIKLLRNVFINCMTSYKRLNLLT